MNAKTVLVTGAHGFIGRHAARHFARQGHAVIGMGHGDWKVEEWQSWGLSRWHETDVSGDALDRYANRPDVIIHCAGGGSVAFSLSEPLRDFHRTVATTANVLEYIRTLSPATRLVYPSSAGVYGIAEVLPIKENSRCAPISPYGVHKWLAEQLVSSYSRQYRIAGSIVRFFSVYGCGLRKQLLWDACQKLSSSDPTFFGTGNEVRDWLHVEDAAELLRVAADHASPLCPVANGGTGEGVSIRELLTHIANQLDPSTEPPTFSELIRAGDPAAYIADTTKANDWGWKPGTHWRERVAEYVAWWRLEMGLGEPAPQHR